MTAPHQRLVLRTTTGLALTAALGLLACASSASGQDRAADRETLWHAKTVAWNTYYRNQDAAGLADFLAEDFVHFGPDGSLETKSEAVRWVAENVWHGGARDFRYKVTEVSFVSDTVANVYGSGSMTDDACPAGQRSTYTSSNLFRLEDGRWRPFFSHSSTAACRVAD